jgi:hypothetical protein
MAGRPLAWKPGRFGILKGFSGSIAPQLISFNDYGLNLIDVDCNYHFNPGNGRKFHAWSPPSVKTWKIGNFRGFSGSMAWQLISFNDFGLNLIDIDCDQHFNPEMTGSCMAGRPLAWKPGRFGIFKGFSGSVAPQLISFNDYGLNLIDVNCNYHFNPGNDRKFHAWSPPSVKTWKIWHFLSFFGFNGSATDFFQ